ncbi:NAD kinase [Brackiella oedipodis]|uniref:NAD kinase n=1 Tax=Brackiella oedipodis TaxID=124225 RepID=UPI0004903E65|nr:NAD kinase [Brackiella oedipodis]
MSFSTVALVGRYQDTGLDAPLSQLQQMLSAHGIEVLVEADTAQHTQLHHLQTACLDDIGQQADLVIVMGGDGTVLGVARKLAPYKTPIVGINHGRLGFITDITINNARQAIELILAGQYETESRSLLQASIIRGTQTLASDVALNDVVFSRSGRNGMIEIHIDYNNEFMYSQRADGLIVSTPTGSTAYALSANGPILHPQIDALLLVPIAPQTLSNRPIVIPSDGTLTLTLGNNPQKQDPVASVHFDMQVWTDIKDGDKVVVKKAHHAVTFLHPKGYSYFSTLRQKLHWNHTPGTA